MSSLPWFRLYRELKDDPKIGELDDASFRVFIESLCWACEKGDGGRTGLTEENANWAFRRNVTPALHTLFQKRLLSKSPTGEIVVPKWDERQKRSDSSAERVRKFRERNSVTLHETLLKRPSNGVEERRGDKKRIYPPAGAGSSPNHAAFIKGWCENFESKFGSKYDFKGGKDGEAVKRVLKLGILTIDLLEIAKKAWDNADITRYRSAATISGFVNNLNQIQAELKNGNQNQTSGRHIENPRNVGVCVAGPSIADQVALKIQRQNDKRG